MAGWIAARLPDEYAAQISLVRIPRGQLLNEKLPPATSGMNPGAVATAGAKSNEGRCSTPTVPSRFQELLRKTDRDRQLEQELFQPALLRAAMDRTGLLVAANSLDHLRGRCSLYAESDGALERVTLRVVDAHPSIAAQLCLALAQAIAERARDEPTVRQARTQLHAAQARFLEVDRQYAASRDALEGYLQSKAAIPQPGPEPQPLFNPQFDVVAEAGQLRQKRQELAAIFTEQYPAVQEIDSRLAALARAAEAPSVVPTAHQSQEGTTTAPSGVVALRQSLDQASRERAAAMANVQRQARRLRECLAEKGERYLLLTAEPQVRPTATGRRQVWYVAGSTLALVLSGALAIWAESRLRERA